MKPLGLPLEQIAITFSLCFYRWLSSFYHYLTSFLLMAVLLTFKNKCTTKISFFNFIYFIFKLFLQLYWGMRDKSCIYLQCTHDILIAMIKLINISILSHRYLYILWQKDLTSTLLGNFKYTIHYYQLLSPCYSLGLQYLFI